MANLDIQPVVSVEHPALEPYRTLRRLKDMERRREFVAEGDKLVIRLLESSFSVLSLLVTPEWLDRIRPLLERRQQETVLVHLATRDQIEQITGFTCYQGIKAVGRIDRPATLDEVFDRAPAPRLFIALEGIANAENMGMLVRNAAAFGVQAVIVGESSCSPFLTRAARCSMGAVFKLPIIESDSLAATLTELRVRGVRRIAAHPHAEQRAPSGSDLAADCCLVFGSEGHGITPEILACCDESAAIPMRNDVDSLNVASAAAAFLYEAARQRGLG